MPAFEYYLHHLFRFFAPVLQPFGGSKVILRAVLLLFFARLVDQAAQRKERKPPIGINSA